MLKNAVASQNLVASIRQLLGDRQKHIGLLSGLAVEEGGGAGPDEVAQFELQLNEMSRTIGELLTLSEREARPKVEQFRDLFDGLKKSWKIYCRDQKRSREDCRR